MIMVEMSPPLFCDIFEIAGRRRKKRKRNPNLFLTKKLENELLKVMRPGRPGPLDDGQKSAVLRPGSDVPLPVECCL